jgi:4,5-DOPA dioxygenase extradiol
MYPAADIPVLQVGIQSQLDPAHHVRLGRSLAALREEDVLVIGSGSFTHNLARLRRDGTEAPQPPDVVAFADWFDIAISEQRTDDLVHYRTARPSRCSHVGADRHQPSADTAGRRRLSLPGV